MVFIVGMVTCVLKFGAILDEMWSYVGDKGNQRWRWHAIDHATGKILAYAFGDRKDAVFLTLKGLLEPFGITRFYTARCLRAPSAPRSDGVLSWRTIRNVRHVQNQSSVWKNCNIL